MNEQWRIYEEALRADKKAEEAGFSIDCNGELIFIRARKKPYVDGVVVARAKTFGGVNDWLLGYEQREFELKTGGEVK